MYDTRSQPNPPQEEPWSSRRRPARRPAREVRCAQEYRAPQPPGRTGAGGRGAGGADRAQAGLQPQRDPAGGRLTVHELNARGLACKAAGRYAEGRAHYDRALSLLERQPHPDPDALATLYHNLGGIEHARGDYAAGEAFARRGLALREALAPADPPAVAVDRVALGALLDGQRRYAESEPLYRAANRVLRRSPEAGAHDLAVALHDLRSMYVLRGRVERGRRLLEQAPAIKWRVLGSGHPSLDVTLHNLEVAARRREARGIGS